MAKQKYDGVIEAVHYKPDQQVDWVRVYLRRGPVFSDRVLLNRQVLIEQLDSGKKFMVGKRIPYNGATFNVSKSLSVVKENDKEILVTGDGQTGKDFLEGVPVV